MPASYSLYELNEYIRRVVALNFPEPIWVHCEIAQIKEVRGNVYLDLIQHDEGSDEIKAQISANIWYKSYLFLKNKLGALLPSLLSQGTNVSLKVQVEFSEKYGMKLIIEDIDPAYTIGQMEMKRQKILQQLTDEGLLHLNKLTDLPRVIQKIAVISSPNAAGYIDFINHLQGNSYGYKYAVQLFETALQGLNTERLCWYTICQYPHVRIKVRDIHNVMDRKYRMELILKCLCIFISNTKYGHRTNVAKDSVFNNWIKLSDILVSHRKPKFVFACFR